jgi:hypothetical protein
VLAAVTIAAILFIRREHEPYYGGHRLSWWAGGYERKFPDEGEAERARAIAAFGTNALPYLLAWTKCEMHASHTKEAMSAVKLPTRSRELPPSR